MHQRKAEMAVYIYKYPRGSPPSIDLIWAWRRAEQCYTCDSYFSVLHGSWNWWMSYLKNILVVQVDMVHSTSYSKSSHGPSWVFMLSQYVTHILNGDVE
jgi:hypothetical protein